MGDDLKHFKSFNHNISNQSMKERIYIFVSFLALTLSFMVLFIYFVKIIFRHHQIQEKRFLWLHFSWQIVLLVHAFEKSKTILTA